MQLGDISIIGTPEDFRANLARLAASLRTVGVALYDRSELEDGCRVYPAIAAATAGQLDILSQLYEEPIEITASVCRTVFETNIVFRYCLSARQCLIDYASQSATDEISICKWLKKLANEDTDPSALRALSARIEQITSVLRKHGRSLKIDRPSISEMAREVGVGNEYDALYGVYSKYVHASAWFVLRPREHIDLPVFRHMMQIHTQLYALDTLKRLEDIRDSKPSTAAKAENGGRVH